MDGVELSSEMLCQFENNLKKIPEKIRRQIHIYECDIFNFRPKHKYNLITIPATTICLLANDSLRLIRLFD